MDHATHKKRKKRDAGVLLQERYGSPLTGLCWDMAARNDVGAPTGADKGLSCTPDIEKWEKAVGGNSGRACRDSGRARNWHHDEVLAVVKACLATQDAAGLCTRQQGAVLVDDKYLEIIRTQLHVGKTPGSYDAIALISTRDPCVYVLHLRLLRHVALCNASAHRQNCQELMHMTCMQHILDIAST